MDKVTARELELFINNDGDLHRQQHVPILKNLMTKHAQGRYDRNAAVKLFMYLVDAGAKKYAREHGSRDAKWHQMFPKAERTHVAQSLRDDFEDEAKLGNYDDLIPKKYKGKVSGKTIREGVEAEDGPLFDGETRKALSEAAGIDESDASAMKFMSPKFSNRARQIKDIADSLILAAKHKDDTQALHDLSMLVESTRVLVAAIGWGKEAAPLHKLGKDLMQAAKGQGIEDRY
jgi:hypothetical protein